MPYVYINFPGSPRNLNVPRHTTFLERPLSCKMTKCTLYCSNLINVGGMKLFFTANPFSLGNLFRNLSSLVLRRKEQENTSDIANSSGEQHMQGDTHKK